MPSHLHSYLWLPLGVTVVELLVAVAVLHAGVGRAMRARGVVPWRVRETVLVSPLLWIGLTLFFLAANHGMLRYAIDVERGAGDVRHLAAMMAAALGGLVIGWFGARAVGKLY